MLSCSKLPQRQFFAVLVDEGDAALAEVPAFAVEDLTAVGADDIGAVGQGDEGPTVERCVAGNGARC